MNTCKRIQSQVNDYLNGQLNEDELHDFMYHIQSCQDCYDELEIYYTVAYGMKQLDLDLDVSDIVGTLTRTLESSKVRLRSVYLRKIAKYSICTLWILGLSFMLFIQFRIWIIG